MDAPIEIRGLIRLKVDLDLVYYWVFLISSVITVFLSHEILFLSHKDIIHDLLPSGVVALSVSTVFLSIRNDILLKPLSSLYKSKMKNYSSRIEIKDSLIRWTLGALLPGFIYLGCLYLIFYPEGIEAKREVLVDIERIAAITAISFLCGTTIYWIYWKVIYRTLLSRVHTKGHDKEDYREWFETTLPSFPLKYALTSFILLLMAILLSFIYVYLYINPLVPLWITGISLLSELIAIFPLFYIFSKRILNKFVERYESVIFPSQ